MITTLAYWAAPFLIPLMAAIGLRWVDRNLIPQDDCWDDELPHRKYADEFFSPPKEEKTSENA